MDHTKNLFIPIKFQPLPAGEEEENLFWEGKWDEEKIRRECDRECSSMFTLPIAALKYGDVKINVHIITTSPYH